MGLRKRGLCSRQTALAYSSVAGAALAQHISLACCARTHAHVMPTHSCTHTPARHDGGRTPLPNVTHAARMKRMAAAGPRQCSYSLTAATCRRRSKMHSRGAGLLWAVRHHAHTHTALTQLAAVYSTRMGGQAMMMMSGPMMTCRRYSNTPRECTKKPTTQCRAHSTLEVQGNS